MKKQSLVILLWVIVITQSCVNLKQVNSYSAKSLTGIKQFEEIQYSFSQYCFDRCQLENITQYLIKREPDCSCSLYKTADSVTLLIYNSVRGYFDGLANLSANELTKYDFDAFKKAITAGDWGSIKIDDADVKAYSAISAILLRATTDLYRKQKIKEYIAQANEPIQLLLSKLQFILQKNLSGELNFKKERLYAYYKELGLGRNISDYEKGKAATDYYQQISLITNQQNQIDSFVKNLRGIASGHQKLYDNRNKLTFKEVQEMIKGYTGDIEDLIAEFNKLKK